MAFNDNTDTELEIVNAMSEAQKCKERIIRHGKLAEAIRTGNRYQRIEEEDTQIIIDNLNQLYKLYGKISNAALSLQADMVLMENQFKRTIRKVEE